MEEQKVVFEAVWVGVGVSFESKPVITCQSARKLNAPYNHHVENEQPVTREKRK